MAAPMQHVGKLFTRSLTLVCGHFRGRNICCHSKRVYTFNQCYNFSTKTNESSSHNDFLGISEEKENDRQHNDNILSDKELHEKYSFKNKELQADLKDVPYGVIRVESHPRRFSKKRSKGTWNPDDSSAEIDSMKRRDKYANQRRSEVQKEKAFYEQNYQHDETNTKNRKKFRKSEFSIDNTGVIDKSRNNVASNDMNYVDNQYFYTVSERGNEFNSGRGELCKPNYEHDERQHASEEHELEFIDSQYFSRESQKHQPSAHRSHSYQRRDKNQQTENLNFIDQQYFELHSGENTKESVFEKSSGHRYDMRGINETSASEDAYSVEIHQNQNLEKSSTTNKKKQFEKHTGINSRKGDRPESAFDVALEVRKELKSRANKENADEERPRLYSGPVDSKGFRILKNQVPDVMNTPSAIVVKLLKDSIIYNQDNIIAIEKPYGLPSHGGPGVHMSVGQLLPSLARLVDPSGQLETLHLVHRLDKQTTGVMLLAKTAETAFHLHGAFRRREVIKKYWVLTKGVPVPDQGVIDIPMAEGTVGRYHRMVLKPEATPDTRLVAPRSNVESHQAITEYKVLASHGPAALVECTPLTGIKHQIRVHLAFGLNTPILGDHKYSHIIKLAPQRLHPELLQRLGIRQSKVRHLPMMLHAKSLLLPEFLEGRNIFISCRLPLHFRINMSRLKIKPPRKSN